MLNVATYADICRPARKRAAAFYDFAVITGASIIIALSAQAAILIGLVPITFQTSAILMLAAMLGARRATLAVLVYIAQGVAGLPVFAAAKAGPAVLVGPTAGYLIGFVGAAFVVGYLADKGWDRKIWSTMAAMIIGSAILYTFGLAWLGILMGFKSAFLVGLYPFIIGDIIKIILAAAMLPAGWKLLNLIDKKY